MKQKLIALWGNSDYRKLIESFLSLSFIRVADFLFPIIVLPYLIGDIVKSKKMLNYQPSHTTDKGIEEAVVWHIKI